MQSSFHMLSWIRIGEINRACKMSTLGRIRYWKILKNILNKSDNSFKNSFRTTYIQHNTDLCFFKIVLHDFMRKTKFEIVFYDLINGHLRNLIPHLLCTKWKCNTYHASNLYSKSNHLIRGWRRYPYKTSELRNRSLRYLIRF